jgi:hypothetical protein
MLRVFLESAFFSVCQTAGTDVMIFLNIFAEKFSKKLAFLTQNKAELCKNLIITLVFEKNAIFSPKIVKNRRNL